MKRIYFFLCCWFTLTLGIAQGTCIYLAYDGFASQNVVPLHTNAGGSGWASAWVVQNNNTSAPGYEVASGSLNYNALQTFGNSAKGGYAYLTAGRRLDTQDGGAFDIYTNNNNVIGSEYGTNLWTSILLRKELNNDEPVFYSLHGDNNAWCNNCATSNRIEVGYFGTASNTGTQKFWSLRINNTVTQTNVPITLGSAAFFVIHLTFNNTGTVVDLYVNPATLGNTQPATSTLTQTSTVNHLIRSTALYLGSAYGNGLADEIRFGESYACVAPDNNVAVNLSPIGIVGASQTSIPSGTTITLDGSASYDPEGQTLTYTWNFGDGSPIITNQPIVTHSFMPLGVLTVSLAVTDNTNQTNVAYSYITVYDVNGKYPCSGSLTLLQAASCNQNNGVVRINAQNIGINLYDNNSQPMTVTNGNEFHNLAAGNYLYIGTDGNAIGCKDSIPVVIPTDSSACAGWSPNLCKMNFGINVSGIADWEKERPFRNLFKLTRPEPIAYHDNCNCWDNGTYLEFQYDSAEYPIQIPQSTSAAANTYLRYILSSNEGALTIGQTYVLLYDGVGVLQMQGGVSVVSNAPNRIEFTVTVGGNIWFNLTQSQLGDHVRNIRVVRLADELIDTEANVFYAVFKEKLAPFKTIRFMDWGHTNGNPNIEWQNRTHLSRRTYSGARGVPYEVMIRLANETDKDVWVCVPHQADENYITQMALLFKNTLNPNRTIYLEYSNEVWNWLFDQAYYNDQNKPMNLNYGEAYSEKAKRVFQIWHNVFGNEKARVKRVLGLQLGYNWLNEQIIAQIPPSEWDYGSPSCYVGLNHGSTGNPVLGASSTPQDVVLNAHNFFISNKENIKQDYRNIKLFGKKIINYEGGQHFTNFTQPPYLQAMYDAQLTTDIYNLYDELIDSIRIWGSEMPIMFTLAGQRQSIYGSWGHLEDIDQNLATQPAPKYQAILDNAPTSPQPVIIGTQNVYNNQPYTYFVTDSTNVGAQYTWNVQGGTIIGANNLPHVTIIWSLATPQQVTLSQQNNGSCAGKTSFYPMVTQNIAIQPTTTELMNVIQLYPNPVENLLYIHYQGTNNAPIQVMIRDIYGRILVEKTLIQQIEIEMASYASGIYLVEIQQGKERVSYKVVK